MSSFEMQSPNTPSGKLGAAVAEALKSRRKRRAATAASAAISTQLPRDEYGLQDLNEYWDKATKRQEAEDDDYSDQGPEEEEQFSAMPEQLDATTNNKPRKRRPRFSLGSQSTTSSTGDKENNLNGSTPSKVKDFVQLINAKRSKNAFITSPSELSRVSTLPPTPMPQEEEEEEEETPERARVASKEDENGDVEKLQQTTEQIAAAAKKKIPPAELALYSPEAPTDDNSLPPNDQDAIDDDDDADLVPPPPPEEDVEDENLSDHDVDADEDNAEDNQTGGNPNKTPENTSAPAEEDDNEEIVVHQSPSNKSLSRVILDDDDDDDEGAGFNFVQDESDDDLSTASTFSENAPLSPGNRGGKRRKTPPPVTSDDDEDYISPELHRKKPAKRRAVFSPQGYPTGPREYQAVPVSDYKDSPSPSQRGLRRSRRARYKPLAYWKNERAIYAAHSERGVLGDAMGCMPVVEGVLHARPTPYRKRKPTNGQKNKLKPQKNQVEAQDQESFDARKLENAFRYLDGEEAQIWDEAAEDAVVQKVVSRADNLTTTSLPLPKRSKSDGNVVGQAAQSFNIAPPDNPLSPYVGYITGNLLLPPKGIKDPESTGACTQVFTVCTCQPESVEVAYGDPHEEEGALHRDTAQRFLLRPGDQFRVPPGNAYRLQNHSDSTPCLLAWTIIRPRAMKGTVPPKAQR